jgi:hypothetical protein
MVLDNGHPTTVDRRLVDCLGGCGVFSQATSIVVSDLRYSRFAVCTILKQKNLKKRATRGGYPFNGSHVTLRGSTNERSSVASSTIAMEDSDKTV